jgi:hypothetical protein
MELRDSSLGRDSRAVREIHIFGVGLSDTFLGPGVTPPPPNPFSPLHSLSTRSFCAHATEVCRGSGQCCPWSGRAAEDDCTQRAGARKARRAPSLPAEWGGSAALPFARRARAAALFGWTGTLCCYSCVGSAVATPRVRWLQRERAVVPPYLGRCPPYFFARARPFSFWAAQLNPTLLTVVGALTVHLPKINCFSRALALRYGRNLDEPARLSSDSQPLFKKEYDCGTSSPVIAIILARYRLLGGWESSPHSCSFLLPARFRPSSFLLAIPPRCSQLRLALPPPL